LVSMDFSDGTAQVDIIHGRVDAPTPRTACLGDDGGQARRGGGGLRHFFA